jgi:DNA invertase Pin-like site-specific DNA recombinase
MIAGIIAEVMAEERRQLIRRTKAGMRRARDEGKWIGNVPAGFVRSGNGYLKPNLDPDYDEGETRYLDVVNALEQIVGGGSYNQTAKETPNITRQGLANIHPEEERRAWYLEGEAGDDRVAAALELVSDT